MCGAAPPVDGNGELSPRRNVSTIAVFVITSYVRAACRDRTRERGASLVEYCLLVGLIALVCVGAVTFFGGRINGGFSSAGQSGVN